MKPSFREGASYGGLHLWSFYIKGNNHKSTSQVTCHGESLSWKLFGCFPITFLHRSRERVIWKPEGQTGEKTTRTHCPFLLPLVFSSTTGLFWRDTVLDRRTQSQGDSLVSNVDTGQKRGGQRLHRRGRCIIPQDPPALAWPCWGPPMPTENT